VGAFVLGTPGVSLASVGLILGLRGEAQVSPPIIKFIVVSVVHVWISRAKSQDEPVHSESAVHPFLRVMTLRVTMVNIPPVPADQCKVFVIDQGEQPISADRNPLQYRILLQAPNVSLLLQYHQV
jgi:hypothetical protein